jgi:hypothetical protein
MTVFFFRVPGSKGWAGARHEFLQSTSPHFALSKNQGTEVVHNRGASKLTGLSASQNEAKLGL